ncbi:MAG: hypothetical protein IJA80_00800 [Clostridia bacterium]|nr:hypothetical protein [Clostridia bacterium]
MAKKQYTPEEFKAKVEKSNAKKENFSKVFLSSIAVLLSLVITFSVVSLAFTYVGKAGQTTVVSGQVQGGASTNVDNSGSNNDATVPSDDTTDMSSDDVTDAPADDDATTDAPAGDNNATDAPSGAVNADQEALDMYKKAVAAARTKSKSVIRVKDGAINYKGIAKAGPLSGAASTLMGMFMAKDEASIKVKNEAWDKTKLPDASALTLNGVQKITRVEKGNTYVITVVAKNATNPKTNGDGVGSVAGVIEDSQITGAIGAVPLLEINNINIAYENVTAVATIDKATGNLTALDINAPCILGLDAKIPLVGSINGAQVGIQVITEYKISY